MVGFPEEGIYRIKSVWAAMLASLNENVLRGEPNEGIVVYF
jgi:hypothetical protein